MGTKLTLRIDEKLISQAKMYARKSGRSVSQLVADYFGLLGSGAEKKSFDMTPKVRSLKGVFRGITFEINSYRSHLEDKYL